VTPVGLNRTLAGKRYHAGFVVTAEAIEDYARATNDPNDAYLAGAGSVASPVWPVVPAFGLFMAAAKDPDLGADFLRLVHGAEAHVLGPPIRPGDTLSVDAVLESITDVAAGEAFTVSATETNQDGDEVARVSGTMVIRGGARPRQRRGAPHVDAPGAIAFEQATKVDADQARRYAAASGDHNPIHLDDDVAKAARLPGVILHGMCTMAFATKAAVDGLAGGDPTRVREVSVEFSKPVFPGQELTTRLWPLSEDGGVATYGFSTHQPAGAAVLRGGRVAIDEG